MQIESNFTNVVIGIMVSIRFAGLWFWPHAVSDRCHLQVVEGVGRALDPEVDLMVLAGPILLREKAKLVLLGRDHK